MHQDGSAGETVQFAETADVVDVRVSADDGFHGELVAGEQVHDAADLIAGVDDQSFARERIADDGAIALQHAYGNGDVNQFARCGFFSFSGLWFSHLKTVTSRKYNIREVSFFALHGW